MKPIVVVGAGVVGVSCALALRQAGAEVLLLDRGPAARETSAGNAGVIANCAVLPLARADLLPRLPKWFFNLEPKFRLRHAQLFALMPWLARFVARCNQTDCDAGARALGWLLADAADAHVAWLREADAMHLLNDNGWLKLYRESAQKDFVSELEAFTECGVAPEVIARDALHELEPDLSPVYLEKIRHAIWLPRTPAVKDPARVCDCYLQMFLARGGKFEQTAAHALHGNGDGWRIVTQSGDVAADKVVVALGAWSPKFLASLKLRWRGGNPIAMERGYHFMLKPRAGHALRRPVMDVGGGFVMAPMADGIRITSASELVAHETAPSPRQLLRLMPEASRALAFADDSWRTQTPWMGRRPSTPDSLPLIGELPAHRGVFCAFGHGHLGFTLGPVSGKIIAQGVAGKWDSQCAAFSPGRFL